MWPERRWLPGESYQVGDSEVQHRLAHKTELNLACLPGTEPRDTDHGDQLPSPNVQATVGTAGPGHKLFQSMGTPAWILGTHHSFGGFLLPKAVRWDRVHPATLFRIHTANLSLP